MALVHYDAVGVSVPTEPVDAAVLDAIGRDIGLVADVRAYGLYDYSAYPSVNGGLKAHLVRDELTRGRQVVFESDSPREARLEYERLCSVFLGRRAVEIVSAALSNKLAGYGAPQGAECTQIKSATGEG